MIIGIEGTGSQGWLQFDMQRSYVRKVLQQSQQAIKYYFIGPCMTGSDGPQIVDGAWKLIHERLKGTKESVQLTGYSRGAAYCIFLAQQVLDSFGEGRISHLILFDAVARQAEFRIPDQIPASVKIAFHAYRDPRGGSRDGFENVGLWAQNGGKTQLFKKMFPASHGGMGGTWYDAKEDENGDHSDDAMNVLGKGANSQSANQMRVALNSSVDNRGMAVAPNFRKSIQYTQKNYPSVLDQQISDRNQLNIPPTPVMSIHQDRMASELAGVWMWQMLTQYGVLPSGSSGKSSAPTTCGKYFTVGSGARVS
ncbi:MAG: hypothetical protein WA324_18640 [Bryobacteraceae bacterium]